MAVLTNEQALVVGVVAVGVVGFAIYKARALASALNPVDPDNVVNQAAQGVFKAVSGNDVDSLGTWLYGWINEDEWMGF